MREPAFTWKNRQAAVRRIFVLITCTKISVDDAINQTIFKSDRLPDGSITFRYCRHPAQITEPIKNKIKEEIKNVLHELSERFIMYN